MVMLFSVMARVLNIHNYFETTILMDFCVLEAVFMMIMF